MRQHDRSQYFVHVAALLPLVVAVMLFSGWPGPDSVGDVLRFTGRGALVLLLLSLVPTAVRVTTGYGRLVRWRRWLGLYAFFYALIHLAIFVGLDYALDLRQVLRAVRDSPSILYGAAALALLAPLAITSTQGWARRLGRGWLRLHRVVYLAATLAVVHYALLFKELRISAVVAGAALAVLLGVRLAGRLGLRAGARSAVTDTAGSSAVAPADTRTASERLVAHRYRRRRVWWAFVASLLLLSVALYLLGLQTWEYGAIALAILLGWWARG